MRLYFTENAFIMFKQCLYASAEPNNLPRPPFCNAFEFQMAVLDDVNVDKRLAIEREANLKWRNFMLAYSLRIN